MKHMTARRSPCRRGLRRAAKALRLDGTRVPRFTRAKHARIAHCADDCNGRSMRRALPR